MRVNSRNTAIPILSPNRKPNPTANNPKKALLKPIPSKPNESFEMEDENQPISDFPTPPYQIVSYKHGQPGEMVTLPQLLSAPQGEIPQLALQKLKQCCRICDFSDKLADATSKVSKKATLNELIDCYSNPKLFARLSRECHQQLIEMFAANVFRPPPNIPRAVMISDDVIIEDTAWPHLQLVYILFLKFLECDIDPRILQYKLDPKFISNLFAILDFPDERERIQAKTVIATIHNKVPPQRKILHNIALNLLMSVPEGLEMNAATHLLDLFYLFTESQLPPLAPSLIQAFEKVLLPLHLHARCQRYFSSLVRCVMMLVQKDFGLGNSLLQFLIAHWPLTLDHKSELFIDEITQILDDSMPRCIDQNIEDILRCICIAAKSSCTTLADKSLKFLRRNRIQNLIVEDPDHLLGVIFPTLYQIAREHWHRNLQLEALNVMNSLVCLVPQQFTKAAAQFKQDVLTECRRKEMKKNLWDSIAQIAIDNDQTIDAESVNSEFTAFYGIHKPVPEYLLRARQKALEKPNEKTQKSQIVLEVNGVEQVEDYDSVDSNIDSNRNSYENEIDDEAPLDSQQKKIKRRNSNNDLIQKSKHHHKHQNFSRFKSKDLFDCNRDSPLSDGETVNSFYENEEKMSYNSNDFSAPSILQQQDINQIDSSNLQKNQNSFKSFDDSSMNTNQSNDHNTSNLQKTENGFDDYQPSMNTNQSNNQNPSNLHKTENGFNSLGDYQPSTNSNQSNNQNTSYLHKTQDSFNSFGDYQPSTNAYQNNIQNFSNLHKTENGFTSLGDSLMNTNQNNNQNISNLQKTQDSFNTFGDYMPSMNTTQNNNQNSSNLHKTENGFNSLGDYQLSTNYNQNNIQNPSNLHQTQDSFNNFGDYMPSMNINQGNNQNSFNINQDHVFHMDNHHNIGETFKPMDDFMPTMSTSQDNGGLQQNQTFQLETIQED